MTVIALFGVLAVSACAAAPPQPDGLTPQGVSDFVVATNETRWNSIVGDRQIDRPDVDFVRFVMQRDAPSTWVECMAAAGYPNALAVGRGVYFGTEDGDDSPGARAALWGCTVEYPVHPAYLGRLSSDQQTYLYDSWVERVIPCLRALGFSVPILESRGEFLSVHEVYLWSPYDLVHTSTLSWDSIDQACPPPDPAIYGDWR